MNSNAEERDKFQSWIPRQKKMMSMFDRDKKK